MLPRSLAVAAYAKINLSLEVLGRRADGYHDVVTILRTIDLSDRVAVCESDDLIVECDDPALVGEDNIVWVAANRLAERAGISPRARIHVGKVIPVAAGLGGGSSDAASALWALNRFWGLNLPRHDLASVAGEVGSDVPFLIEGGTGLGTGRGDQIAVLDPLPEVDVLLVVPQVTISGKTPRMYQSLVAEDFSDGVQTREIAERLGDGGLTSGECRNAFERAAREIFPSLSGVWNRVAEATAYPPRLSGAGPALFCFPSSETEQTRANEALRGTGATAYLVRTIFPPARGEVHTSA